MKYKTILMKCEGKGASYIEKFLAGKYFLYQRGKYGFEMAKTEFLMII